MTERKIIRRRSRYADVYPEASVLKVLSPTNPKKPGSKAHDRFNRYYGCRTVGEFIRNGGTYQDLVYDIGRKYIRVTVIH
jgi:hypothetical protein